MEQNTTNPKTVKRIITWFIYPDGLDFASAITHETREKAEEFFKTCHHGDCKLIHVEVDVPVPDECHFEFVKREV